MRYLFLVSMIWAPFLHAQSTLQVEVFLNRSEPGSLLSIALCQGESEYDDVDRCIGRTVKSDGEKVLIEFADLEPGEYAIKALHDLNANGEMDFNFLGIPQEPYGFSNDPKVTFSEPSFQAASFSVAPGRTKIQITMKG